MEMVADGECQPSGRRGSPVPARTKLESRKTACTAMTRRAKLPLDFAFSSFITRMRIREGGQRTTRVSSIGLRFGGRHRRSGEDGIGDEDGSSSSWGGEDWLVEKLQRRTSGLLMHLIATLWRVVVICAGMGGLRQQGFMVAGEGRGISTDPPAGGNKGRWGHGGEGEGRGLTSRGWGKGNTVQDGGGGGVTTGRGAGVTSVGEREKGGEQYQEGGQSRGKNEELEGVDSGGREDGKRRGGCSVDTEEREGRKKAAATVVAYIYIFYKIESVGKW